jgi:hypothetical protein
MGTIRPTTPNMSTHLQNLGLVGMQGIIRLLRSRLDGPDVGLE